MGRAFDLNIERVLEHWTVVHALREIIANALDEWILTGTEEPRIFRDEEGRVHVRDFGRGLRHEHLTQNESSEKHARPDDVVGKFGVGLKDALATLDRHDVDLTIRSRHATITTGLRPKAGFPDVTTLHAIVDDPSGPELTGTELVLFGDELTDETVAEAKNLFLHYSGDEVLDVTEYGQVLEPVGGTARIYVNGLRVATEDDFLFSYNVTKTSKALRQALNRERSHVGRSAYTDRVKAILLASEDRGVAEALVADLQLFEKGTQRDETKWIDIAIHACRRLNATGDVIFLTAGELREFPDFLSRARDDGYEPVTVPDNVRAKLSKLTDVDGNPIRDLARYIEEWSDSFEFDFVDASELTEGESAVWEQADKLFAQIGGRPRRVKDVAISETMRPALGGRSEAVGVWEPAEGRIVIRRDQLASLESFAGTLLHEAAHALSGASDLSPRFEEALTNLLGKAAAAGLA